MRSQHLYAVHDYAKEWAALVKGAAKTGWVVETLEVGDDPNDRSGGDFTERAGYGLTVIGRLNASHHGKGTIPLPDRYDEFAIRCGNFVRASVGCTTWLIGNEPNIRGEWPDNNPIRPEQYVRCYKMVRDAIKAVSLDHQVMIAPVAPYNNEFMWCVDYWEEVIRELGRQGTATDGFPLHTYSRGGSVASITSEDKMDFPFDGYYNGFRAYRDFLAAIPSQLAHLRAYITETDQLDPWVDANSGWVMEAYREIDAWNKTAGTIKVDCLALYRWPHFDQWWIEGKNGVIEDFRQTLATTNFLVQTAPSTQPSVPSSGPIVTITALSGVNIRSGPGTGYTSPGAVPVGAVLPLTGKSEDGQWYRVDSPWGSGWAYASLVEVSSEEVTPIVTAPSPPATPSKLDRAWLIGSLSRVLGIDPKVAQAVLAIESAGRSFEGDNMIIRFEVHVFANEVEKKGETWMPEVKMYFRFGNPPWTGQEWRQDGGGWQALHDGGQGEEWAAFTLARKIDESAAMKAISMGSAQILGTNYSTVGYATPQEMFNAYNDKTTGEFAQVAGFFAYVRAANLVEAIRNKDWRVFASSYNGVGQIEYYANAIATKYAELGGR